MAAGVDCFQTQGQGLTTSGAKLRRKFGLPFRNLPLKIGFPKRFHGVQKCTTNTVHNGCNFNTKDGPKSEI